MGFVMAFVASHLSIQIESIGNAEQELDSTSFCIDVKRNLKEVKQACSMKAYYSVILYLLIGSIAVPSFSSFSYYFLLDEVHLSKFMYSMLTLLAYICLMIGSLLYNRYFSETEYRKLILIDALITIVFAPI